MEKPKQILELEKALGIELEEMKPVFELGRTENNQSYQLNYRGEIVGLHLSDLQLNDITPLKGFIRLKELHLVQNEIIDISILESFSELHTLNLYINKIKSIEPLKYLRKLEVLSLGINEINDVTALQGLDKLRDLGLGFNQLKDITALQGLTKLTKLNLVDNQLKDISGLQGLTQLTELFLSGNQLTDTSAFLRLTELTSLGLSQNQLTDISTLKALTQLTNLNLSDNQLTEISALKWLTQLRKLNLQNNRLTDISALLPLIPKIGIQITMVIPNSIYVGGNPLQNPPMEIVKQGREAVLQYFEQNKKEETLALDEFTNNEIKLVLVGNSHAGKSTFGHYLRHGEYKELPTTHWMEIETWHHTIKEKEYVLRLFDFGGQEYYHDTHHLFFTNNTLYVLLWNKEGNCLGEKEILQMQRDGSEAKVKLQMYPIYYWLDAVQYHTNKNEFIQVDIPKMGKGIAALLGHYEGHQIKEIGKDYITIRSKVNNLGFNDEYEINEEFEVVKKEKKEEEINKETKLQERNILVVQNKADTLDDVVHLPQHEIRKDYPEVFDFAAIAMKSGRRWNILKEILDEMIESNTFLGQKMLASFGYLKGLIQRKKFEEQLSLYDFQTFCNTELLEWDELSNKIKKQKESILFSTEMTKVFAQYMNDIGVLLYFSKNKELENTVFVNQGKIIDQIYNILLHVEKKQGEVNKQIIKEVLRKTSFEDECKQCAALLKQFKIVFEHPFKLETYVAPLYLPKQALESVQLFIDQFKKPRYRIRYVGFIHKSVVLDFFQQYGKEALMESEHSSLYYYWREGIILKDPKTQSIVMVKFVMNESEDKEEINAYIEITPLQSDCDGKYIEEIKASLEQINRGWETELEVTHNGVDFLPLKKIHEEEKANNFNFLHNKKYYRLSDFKKYLKKPLAMKKIFISYSNEDYTFKKELEKHLKPLASLQLAQSWSCEEMTPGLWHEQIQEELESSDIIIFMLSINFMASDYIVKEELFKTFEQMKSNTKKNIICVLVKEFSWRNYPSFEKISGIAANDIDDKNLAILKLKDYQFMPYYTSGQSRCLRAIEEWEFPNKAYTLVTDQIIKLVTK